MSIQPVATNRTMRSIALPLAVLCIVLMLALGGATFAIIHEYTVSSCINTSLATRQKYIDADHRAEVAKVTGQVRGLRELRRDAEGGIAQFTRASENYLHRIAVIDREQKKHQLGNC